MTARLVVSLSGIGALTLDRCAELSAELAHRRVPLSLLFAPRLAGSAAAVDWVRGRQAAGDALLMHGFDHVTVPPLRRIGRRIKPPSSNWAAPAWSPTRSPRRAGWSRTAPSPRCAGWASGCAPT